MRADSKGAGLSSAGGIQVSGGMPPVIGTTA